MEVVHSSRPAPRPDYGIRMTGEHESSKIDTRDSFPHSQGRFLAVYVSFAVYREGFLVFRLGFLVFCLGFLI